jgi:hypothetical protein
MDTPVIGVKRNPNGTCAECTHGTKRRDDGTLVQCGCRLEGLSERVPPILRHGEVMLAEGWRDMEVWPLTSRTQIGGDYDQWRHQVWRSLMHYVGQQPSWFAGVAAMEAGRIAEIHFTRDTGEYRSYRDLIHPKLLILICGRYDLSNAYSVDLTRVVLGLRADHGVPSWVYTTHKSHLGRTMEEVIRDAPRIDLVTGAAPPTRHSRREGEVAPVKPRRSRPWNDD